MFLVNTEGSAFAKSSQEEKSFPDTGAFSLYTWSNTTRVSSGSASVTAASVVPAASVVSEVSAASVVTDSVEASAVSSSKASSVDTSSPAVSAASVVSVVSAVMDMSVGICVGTSASVLSSIGSM